MRAILCSLLSLATVATTLAVESPSGKRAATEDDWDEKVPDTIFNGQTVPPMIELGPKDLDEEVSKGNWMVEFFSPQCPHCMHFKPTYQTAYEFYYTSKPLPTKEEGDGDTLNSFTRYYDFKFAKVDCLVNADLCNKKEIMNYPSIIYYVDGKLVQKEKGAKSMEDLSKWIEQLLETIRPGSRKEGGPKLPKPGAKSVETGPDTEEEVKQEEKKKAVEKSAASTSAKSAPTKAAKPVTAQPTSNANPSGMVEALTLESFQSLVSSTLDPWFIKFYAPWCHHCQALAPNWANLARQMKGKLNIAEVNCDVEKKLCKEAHVRGYPTLLFFRGSERVEYDGLRGLGDLLDYSEKAAAAGAGVQDIDAAEFKKLEETEEVIFTYFYDHATTSEDFQALDRLTLSLVGKAKLVKTNDKELYDRFKISTWPRLMVSRDGKPTYYPHSTPKDMRDTKKIFAWMKSVWLPIVPELKANTAREIMDGKVVVLAILDPKHEDDFSLSKRELKSAALEWIEKQEANFKLERQELRDAKQLQIEEAQDKDDQNALRKAKSITIDMDDFQHTQVGFAWVDGTFWDRWIRSTYGIDVKEGERVIINDEDNHRYWDTTVSGEAIRPSRSSILDTVNKVTANPNSITAQYTTGKFTRTFYTVRNFTSSHPFLALGMFVGSITAVVLFGKSRSRRRGFGHFQYGEKDGLLGGMGNGNGAKHD